MKKVFAIAAMAAMLLSGCAAKADSSSDSKSNNSGSSSITLKAEDSSKLHECTEVTCMRLGYIYPGVKYDITYNNDDTSTVAFDVTSEKWNDDTLDIILKNGRTTFRKGTDTETNSEGETVPTGEIILDNSDIDKVSSTVMNTGAGMEYAVSIQTNMAGQDKLAAATGELAGTSTPLSIWFDNDLISAPTVATQIVDGNAVISGNLTAEKSMEIAAAIDSGALPCGLEVTEYKVG
ncbi:MAG: hypothetical protein K6A75_10100 [Ruminococcus sp.]|nr:hypothetical protein [Ruminococcus sp.]